MVDASAQQWDVVVVGSGAGGGTLAARLAESGLRVFLLEAGGDAREETAPRLPDDYDVPGFHPFASENAAMRWDFRVRHYADAAQQARDPKSDADGVLYPRAATLGGCTAHNAGIFVLPHDSDWNGIAELTGDASWRASKMRRYAKRLEACRHRPFWNVLSRLGIDPTGHGWHGWLPTERAMPLEALFDHTLTRVVIDAAEAATLDGPNPIWRLWRALRGRGDPNARQWHGGAFEGACYTPLSTSRHRRVGSRERVREVAARHPERLHIELNALVTRIRFDEQGKAIGVDYLKGHHLYRAHPTPDGNAGLASRVDATHEVVLCGGAFNTPQLLMLSGVGPADELARHGIASRVDLPGVGRNLQDRYEIAVTHRMAQPWTALAGADFARDDPVWREWSEAGQGMYTSSGAIVAMMRRSDARQPDPDVFAMALPARFEGYFPGYSAWLPQHRDYLTWAVLKAHTRNRAGTVKLRSADPRDTPEIAFNYFHDADDPRGEDLQAVIDAIGHVRRVMAPLLRSGAVAAEVLPGPAVQSAQALADYVKDNAWGHHAACSCPIGEPGSGGVLDARLRVHGARGLRVVDASVFPRIPGFFLASAVYMVAEKAADMIVADTRASRQPP